MRSSFHNLELRLLLSSFICWGLACGSERFSPNQMIYVTVVLLSNMTVINICCELLLVVPDIRTSHFLSNMCLCSYASCCCHWLYICMSVHLFFSSVWVCLRKHCWICCARPWRLLCVRGRASWSLASQRMWSRRKNMKLRSVLFRKGQNDDKKLPIFLEMKILALFTVLKSVDYLCFMKHKLRHFEKRSRPQKEIPGLPKPYDLRSFRYR